MSEIDGVDRAILEELLVDARRSCREIARRRGLSPTTVASRLERMEEAGIIRGYLPDLDDERLGFDLHAVIGIRIAHGRLRELEEKLARDPHPYAIYDLTGEYDALVIARFRDRRDLDRFVKHALQDPLVERTNTQVVLNRVKEERRILLPAPPAERPKRTARRERSGEARPGG